MQDWTPWLPTRPAKKKGASVAPKSLIARKRYWYPRRTAASESFKRDFFHAGFVIIDLPLECEDGALGMFHSENSDLHL